MFLVLKIFTWLTISSAASLIPVAAKTQTRGTAVASGLNAVILGIDCDWPKTQNGLIIYFHCEAIKQQQQKN